MSFADLLTDWLRNLKTNLVTDWLTLTDNKLKGLKDVKVRDTDGETERTETRKSMKDLTVRLKSLKLEDWKIEKGEDCRNWR